MKRPSILYLHNPTSNQGVSETAWEQAASLYPLLPHTPINVFTIPDLSKLIAKTQPDIVAIAGGDGTINVVCTAILKLKVKPTIAVLPLGFGNAMSYSLGVETLEKAMSVLKEPTHRVAIDVIAVNHPDSPYAICNASVGFDARIVHYHHHNPYIGLRSYALSGLRSLVQHQSRDLVLTIDHQTTIRTNSSSLVIANCPTIGKQYMVSGQALLNDGYLDCTIFSSKFAYVSNMRLRGFKHPLYSEKGKIFFKAKHLQIAGEPYLQVDGNPLFHHGLLQIEIVPQALTFLRNPHNPELLPFVLKGNT